MVQANKIMVGIRLGSRLRSQAPKKQIFEQSNKFVLSISATRKRKHIVANVEGKKVEKRLLCENYTYLNFHDLI